MMKAEQRHSTATRPSGSGTSGQVEPATHVMSTKLTNVSYSSHAGMSTLLSPESPALLGTTLQDHKVTIARLQETGNMEMQAW